MMFRFNSEDGDVVDVVIDRVTNTASINVSDVNEEFNPNFGIDEL